MSGDPFPRPWSDAIGDLPFNDCGEDMRTYAFDRLGGMYGRWHRWFAWYPVRTDEGWCWLRYVGRQFVVKPWLPHPLNMGFWEYRP